MKLFTTHFQIVKKIISGPVNTNISTSPGRWKWIIAVITTVVLMVGLEEPGNAATRYWVPGGSSANFNDNTNWATTSGGAKGAAGTVAWATTDIATFDVNSGSPSVTINGTYTIATITISSGTVTFSGSSVIFTVNTSLNFSNSTSFTIGSTVSIELTAASPFTNNSWTIYGPGTILLDKNNMTFPGTGGTFNASTPPNVTIVSGTTATQSAAYVTVGNLSIGTSGGTTTSLTLAKGFSLTVTGTYANYGTGADGLIGANPGGTIIFSGSNQSFPQGGGGTAGGVFNKSPNVTVADGKTVTVDAATTIDTLSIGQSTAATSTLNLESTTLTVAGTFANYGTSMNGTGLTCTSAGSGTIAFSGTASFPVGTASAGGNVINAPNLTVSGTETLNASATVTNLTISGTSLTLNSGTTITVNGTFSNTKSLIGPGTIIFNYSTATGAGTFSSNPNVTINDGVTLTLGNSFTVNNLSIGTTTAGTAVLNLGTSSYILTVAGTFANYGTGSNGITCATAGKGTIAFSGTSATAASFPLGTASAGGAVSSNANLSITNSGDNAALTLNGAVTVFDLTIGTSACSLILNNNSITVTGTTAAGFSNSSNTAGDGLVGPGTIIFDGTGLSFPVGNGSNGIFSASTSISPYTYPNVTIANSKSVTLNASTTVNNLSIGTSASTARLALYSGANSYNLTVAGTFKNYGTGADGLVGKNPGGTITFAGSGQTFPQGSGSGGVFNNYPLVTIANGVAVMLDNSVSIGGLSIGTSSTSPGPNSSLTLNSDQLTIEGGGSNVFNNYGTGANGLIGPGTVIFAGNPGANFSVPSGSGQGGVFNGAPSVTINDNLYVSIYGSLTVNNLSIGVTSIASNAAFIWFQSASYNLTVNGTFSNYGTGTFGVAGATPGGGGTLIFAGSGQTFPKGQATQGGAFNDGPNVTIANGVTVSADTVVHINALTLSNASSVFNDGGDTVYVSSNIVNNGTHNSSTGGSITLTGSTTERTLSGGGSYGNLTLNDANGAYLNSNATINGALTLASGILDPGWGGDTVFIAPSGSVSSSGTSWVYGFLAEYFATSGSAVSQTFEVGDSTATYRPVTVTFPSVSTPGYLIVSNTSALFSPAPAIIVQDVGAYWTIINHVIAYPSATVAFTYSSGDILAGTQSTFDAETYIFDPQNSNYGNWLSPWTSTDPTGTTTQSTSVTTFGDFVIGPPPPPVQITAQGGNGNLTFCAGGSVTLNSQVYPPTDDYTYTWYQSPSTVVATGTTTYSATTAGTYFLSVTDNTAMASYTSNNLTVTVTPNPTASIGSTPAAICQGGTTAALGGSFGGDATGAVWSDGGAGGTFANNGGSTPNTTTYTASATASSPITLTLTTSGGTCGTTHASTSLTINPVPVAPTVSFTSPAIVCGSSPVVLTNTTAGSYNYQWLLNGSPIPGATSSRYSATTGGAYTLTLINTTTGCTGAASAAVQVAESPYIAVDTVYIPANENNADTFISVTNPTTFSYSASPSACYVNMSAASVITSTTSSGGGAIEIICEGGNVTVGGGSSVFVVEPGGTLNGFGGDGAETVYIKKGGTYINTGTNTSDYIYYETGANITGGTGSANAHQCPSIGVLYPTNTNDLCTPYNYIWSNADTSSSIDVSTQTDATYSVSVYQGDYSCTSSAVVYRLPYIWVGGNNANDWSTPANWSPPGVPNACFSNVIIPVNGNNPVVNSPVSVGNLTITGSGRELITLNSTLSVCGNWTDSSGTSSYASGRQLILNGSSAQTLSGSLTFDQLAIANTNGGVSLATGTTVGINTSLLLQTGNLNTSNGTVTLNSTSVTQAGIIDNFSAAASPGTGTITGNITAQRYYAAPTATNSYSQHEFGSPVNAPALSEFSGSIASGTAGYVLDPTCDETKLDPNSPYGTVFAYDETHGSGCAIQQWKVLTSGNAVSGQGYSVLTGSDAGTISLTGTPNITGNVTISGTNSGWNNSTKQSTPEHSGWTLASNPYPATLNISEGSLANNVSAGWDGVGVMVWNANGSDAGNYELTTTIAPFQAFMIHKTNAGGGSINYTIYASDRATSASQFYKEAIPNMLNITATNQSTGLVDFANVGFNANATNGFDPNFDALKIAGDISRHCLYTTVSNGDWMYQNVNQSIAQTPAVPMGFRPGVSGTYTLSFDGINSFDATTYITLEDTKLNVTYNVRNGDYSFTSDATSDSWNRFVLHFTPPAIILTQDANCEQPGMINIEQPGSANWNYTITDNNNVTVSSGALNSGNPVSVSVTPGVYTLTLNDNAGYTVVKTLQVQGSQPVVAAFTASATTAQVLDNIVFTGTTANASTYSWDFGDGTTGSGQQASHSYQSAGVYVVKLNVTGSGGCVSITSQTIPVTSRSATGIVNPPADNLNIWSYENRVFVDFSKVNNVDAEVQLYNVLGQMLSDERFGKSALYSKNLTNLEVAYVIVKVINDDQITTRKVFIANVGK